MCSKWFFFLLCKRPCWFILGEVQAPHPCNGERNRPNPRPCHAFFPLPARDRQAGGFFAPAATRVFAFALSPAPRRRLFRSLRSLRKLLTTTSQTAAGRARPAYFPLSWWAVAEPRPAKQQAGCVPVRSLADFLRTFFAHFFLRTLRP